jgi:carbohydrate kinase (thermoresistant glucokinase family)
VIRQGGHAPPGVILLMGVAGCGKSTIGKRLSTMLGWPFRDADSFHPPANIAKMSRGVPLTDEDRAPWLAAIAAWIDDRLQVDDPAIVSCSALKRAYREVLIGRRTGVRLVYLQGSFALIGERMSRRKGHFMPIELLRSQFETLEEPAPDEGALVVPIQPLPKVVAAGIVRDLGLTPARRVVPT